MPSRADKRRRQKEEERKRVTSIPELPATTTPEPQQQTPTPRFTTPSTPSPLPLPSSPPVTTDAGRIDGPPSASPTPPRAGPPTYAQIVSPRPTPSAQQRAAGPASRAAGSASAAVHSTAGRPPVGTSSSRTPHLPSSSHISRPPIPQSSSLAAEADTERTSPPPHLSPRTPFKNKTNLPPRSNRALAMTFRVHPKERSAARAAAKEGNAADWIGEVSGDKAVRFDEKHSRLTVTQAGGTHRRAELKQIEALMEEIRRAEAERREREAERQEQEQLRQAQEAKREEQEAKRAELDIEGKDMVRRSRAHETYKAVAAAAYALTGGSLADEFKPSVAKDHLRAVLKTFDVCGALQGNQVAIRKLCEERRVPRRAVEAGLHAAESALASKKRGEIVHGPPISQDFEDFVVKSASAKKPGLSSELRDIFPLLKTQPMHREHSDGKISDAFADKRQLADEPLPMDAVNWRSTPLLDDVALQKIAEAVGGISGDARKALDVARRTLDRVALRLSKEGKSLDELEQGKVKCSIQDATQAYNDMTRQGPAAFVRKLSMQMKVLLLAVAQCVRRAGVPEVELDTVLTWHLDFLRQTSLCATPSSAPSKTELVSLLTQLHALRLITAESQRLDVFQRVRPAVDEGDLFAALR